MNVSIIIAVCYYIVLIAQFGIMWKAKNPGENEIFSITVPNEKLENEEIKGVQKKYMTMLGIFTVIFVAAPAVMFCFQCFYSGIRNPIWQIAAYDQQ